MGEPSDPADADGALLPGLTEGEAQALPGRLAGVMSHQDPRRQHDLDDALGAPDRA